MPPVARSLASSEATRQVRMCSAELRSNCGHILPWMIIRYYLRTEDTPEIRFYSFCVLLMSGLRDPYPRIGPCSRSSNSECHLFTLTCRRQFSTLPDVTFWLSGKVTRPTRISALRWLPRSEGCTLKLPSSYNNGHVDYQYS